MKKDNSGKVFVKDSADIPKMEKKSANIPKQQQKPRPAPPKETK